MDDSCESIQRLIESLIGCEVLVEKSSLGENCWKIKIEGRTQTITVKVIGEYFMVLMNLNRKKKKTKIHILTQNTRLTRNTKREQLSDFELACSLILRGIGIIPYAKQEVNGLILSRLSEHNYIHDHLGHFIAVPKQYTEFVCVDV